MICRARRSAQKNAAGKRTGDIPRSMHHVLTECVVSALGDPVNPRDEDKVVERREGP